MPGKSPYFLNIFAAAFFCVAFTFAGCAKKGRVKAPPPGGDGADDSELAGGATVDDEEGGLIDPDAVAGGDASLYDEEPDLRGGGFAGNDDLETITFDYDRYALTLSARNALKANAVHLKKHPELQILIEGHCDERGTLGYNLALGQQRAKTVREYYIRLGVSGRTVGTISYGEEKPACVEPEDGCWRENRRAETKVRAQGDAP